MWLADPVAYRERLIAEKEAKEAKEAKKTRE